MTQASFSAMGLAEPLLRAIEALNFTTPTPVQAEAIPKALEGGDWMVSSQTGSGKTVAFLVPTLQRILNSGESAMKAASGPIGLVLCPTRELAQQVAQDAIGLVRQSKGLRIATIMGGTPFAKQIAGLRGAQLVIATPGRLLDLVNQRKIQLGQVKTLVVDEADRMLDLGFAEDLEAIHSLCKGRDQTLMFSATFAPKIMALGGELMDNPQRLALASATGQNTNIEQRLFWADNYNHKRKLLTHWLNDADVDQAIVFASTQSDTEVLARDLEQDGLSAIALHGAMPQAVRNRRLQGLRDGKFKILVATDVAARGIDVPSITHVINFGLPMKAEDYTHRIGRTGRAGREGLAITIAEQGERRKIQGIERFIQQTIPVSEVAGMEPKPFSRSSAKPSGGRGGRDGGRPTTRNRSEGAPRSYDRSAQAPAGEWANKAPRSGERRTFAGAGAGAPRPAFAERSFGDRPRTDRSDRAPREGGFADRQPRERSFSDRAPRDNGFADRAPRERTFGDRPARTADTRTSFRSEASAPSAPRRAPSRPSSFSERSSFAGRAGERVRRG